MQQLRAARTARRGKQRKERVCTSFLSPSCRVGVELEAEWGLRPEALPAWAHWEDIPLQNGSSSEGEDEGSDRARQAEAAHNEIQSLPTSARNLQTAVVQGSLLYAAELWWNGRRI